jgi:exopolysaccharide biosynthesis protein
MREKAQTALVGIAFAISALGAGCSRATPPELTPRLPFPVDTLVTQRVQDGVLHRYVYTSSGPWAIHVLDARLDRCLTPIAVKGAPGAVGRKKTSDLMRETAVSTKVIGGVNADFFLFTPAGVPTGAHVSNGRVVTPPARTPVFAIDDRGMPRIARLSVRGVDSAKFAVDDTALAHVVLLPFHPKEAVGGRPVLARDSVIPASLDTDGQASFTTTRHPRTAVGIADRGRRLLLVTVDGRQKPYSDGMTVRELANLMLALGARDALNLDGGGSTTFVYADPDSAGALRVANHPSDAAGERPVGNALALVRRCGP